MTATNRGGLGPQGFRGPQGIQGPTGINGIQGPTGEQGPTGSTGINGIQGPTGDQGPRGIKGEPGLQGKGFIVYKSGDGYPNSDDFNNEHIGEFYLKKGGDLYCYIPGTTGSTGPQSDLPNFKYVGDVTDESLLVGPTGSQGDQGPTGNQGLTGYTGPQGPTGYQGLTGYTGSQGPTGNQGPTGYTGPQGSTGINGIQGPTGDQGPTGIKGEPGLQGKGFIVYKSGDGYPNSDDFNAEHIGEFYLKKGGDLYCYIPGTTGSTGPQSDLPNFKYVGDVTDESLLVGPTGSQGPTGNQAPTAADYLYKSDDFNLNLITTITTNKILNVVNTSNTVINIKYNSSNNLLINKYSYDSFIYDGSKWYNIINNSQSQLQFDFIYSFNYTGSTPIADIIQNYIPIIKTSNILYTYTLRTVGSTTTVRIIGTFTYDGTTNDGLSFNNATVRNFYNGASISNLIIINFGNIPLSRGGSQFLGLTKLTIEDTKSPTILSNTSMANMFQDATNFNSNISSWNTINVTNMSNMFHSASSFNQPIGNWNTSYVTNMSNMFNSASNFNQNINDWNTMNVTNMFGMIFAASAFNQPIGNWNTSYVTDMSYMFTYASIFNQDISSWNTINVTNMQAMFRSALAFNNLGLSLNNWNTSNVIYMDNMFADATAFNQNIGNWNVSKVNDMARMFQNASAFNQNIGNWNVSKVNDKNLMYSMFRDATVFNNGQAAGETTQKMNWTISFIGTPQYFSTNSALALASSNKPTFR